MFENFGCDGETPRTALCQASSTSGSLRMVVVVWCFTGMDKAAQFLSFAANGATG